MSEVRLPPTNVDATAAGIKEGDDIEVGICHYLNALQSLMNGLD